MSWRAPVMSALAVGICACASGDVELGLKAANIQSLELRNDGTGRHVLLGPKEQPRICPTFVGVAATQNGVTLRQTSAGGDSTTGYHWCQWPAWELAPIDVAEGSTTFELSDGTSTITAEFQSLAAARTVQVVSPASLSAPVGDPVVLQWLPETDVLTTENTVSFTWGPYDAPIATQYTDLQIDGARLSFTISDNPDLPKASTTGLLDVFPGFFTSPGLVRCIGVATCKGTIFPLPASTTPFTLLR